MGFNSAFKGLMYTHSWSANPWWIGPPHCRSLTITNTQRTW